MKKRLGEIITWWNGYKLPSKILFIVTGILSTLWFLIRVLPKPSRAAYPCMRMVAPVASGFIIYLLSLGGLTLLLRKARRNFLRASYLRSGLFVMAAIVALAVFVGRNLTVLSAADLTKSGPDDGPNQAIGKGWVSIPGGLSGYGIPKQPTKTASMFLIFQSLKIQIRVL